MRGRGSAVAFTLASALAASCGEPSDPVSDFPRLGASRGYATSDACIECHPAEHASWSRTFHRTMTQPATLDAIAAPIESLDGMVFTSAGNRMEFSLRGDQVWVELDDPEAKLSDESANESPAVVPRVTRPLVMLSGSHHEQRYWIGSDGDGPRLDLLPAAYLIDEAQWVNDRDLFVSTGQAERTVRVGAWNSNCIRCHTTGGQPRTHVSPPDTSAIELGIACESCHGPGAAHVEARHAGKTPPEPLVVNPATLPAAESAAVCGQCHANFIPIGRGTWNREGAPYRPGDALTVDRHVVRYTAESDEPHLQSWLEGTPSRMETKFWSDGTVLPSGREYAGLIESACFREGGMTCATCHAAHAFSSPEAMLRPASSEDAMCLSCHPTLGEAAALVEHSHHAADSAGSRCINCHMPSTTWGLLRAMPSHRIDIPRAQTTAEHGRPNACNLCHLDRPLSWTATHLTQWFGAAPLPGAVKRDEPAAAVQWLLSGDAVQRAIAAWALGWEPAREASGTAWIPAILAESMVDPVSAVRLVAARSLAADPLYGDLGLGVSADPDARQARRSEVLERWVGSTTHVRAAPNVLLTADGRRDEAAIRALAERRDDRPIFVSE